MSRIPIRLRVTIAFTAVMALLLAGLGAFVFVRLRSDLDATIDQGLRSRTGDVIALVRQADTGLREAGARSLTERGEAFAQVLTPAGAVFDASPPAGRRPLLGAAELRKARRGVVSLDRAATPALGEPVRLLATPTSAQGTSLVVVVGTSLAERDDTLDRLRAILLVGGVVALLVSSVVGYGAAAAALRPVESMRRRAAEISARSPGRRLPVPPARDELQRLGETLNAMLGRLEASLAREREFVADASHELRTPLSVIRAELEHALRAGKTEEELRAAIVSAGEEAEHVSQLAEDLLVLARLDEGALPVRPEPLDARELASHVRDRFARRSAERGREIAVEADGDARLVADRLRLEQAVGNLVDNALRHGRGRVTITVQRVGESVELAVRDEGPGLPEQLGPDAFRRFRRGDAARGPGGAGLGLAIVAAIAEAHGGAVDARTGADGGAEVAIAVPVSAAGRSR